MRKTAQNHNIKHNIYFLNIYITSYLAEDEETHIIQYNTQNYSHVKMNVCVF